MPLKKKIPRNKKRINRKAKKAVKSFPKQIQNAAYLPKSRLVKFTDYRSFVVEDDGFNASGALPPVLEVSANNPRKFIHSTQGKWDAASLTAKGVAVPGIQNWVTNSVPTSTETAPYLNASCLSMKLVITAVPIPTTAPDGAQADEYQDVSKLCVQNNTRNGMFANRNITNTFNSEVVSQTPYVKSANMYYNAHGTPRGATITQHYSFKKSNAGRPMLNSANFFAANTDPLEKDFCNIAILPTHSQKYGLTAVGGTRMANHRVTLSVSYIVLLSEPNGHVSTNDSNQGINLADVPTVADLVGESQDSGL